MNFYRQFGLIGASMAIEVRHPAAAGLARQAIRDRQLAELRPRVEEVREQFQTELRRLPAPFAEMASSHFAGRSAKARNVVMMGEYVPWLLGDALGNPPPETAKAAIAWMFLYEHQLVVDDAVDTESVNPLHAVLLSNLLLQRSMDGFRQIAGDDSSFWSGFQRHCEMAAEAAMRERTTAASPVRDVSQDELLWMGRKSSAVKICGDILARTATSPPPPAEQDLLCDEICTGIQLMDDLCDWEEDLVAGNFTYPLVRSSTWVSQQSQGRLTLRDLTKAMQTAILVTSGAIEETLSATNTFLHRAANRTAKWMRPDSVLERYLTIAIDEHRRDVKRMKTWTWYDTLQTDVLNELTADIDRRHFHEKWSGRLRRLQILAQGGSS